ncbi:MAG: S8 family serine peptidase [Candidatus Omnitrophota bacterium]
MKAKTILTFIGLITLIGLLGSIILFPGSGRLSGQTDANRPPNYNVNVADVRPGEYAFSNTGNPRIEGELNRMAEIEARKGHDAAVAYAMQHRIPMANDRVVVEVEASVLLNVPNPTAATDDELKAAMDRSVAAIQDRVTALGGNVEKVIQSVLRCTIDIHSLEHLADIPEVQSIRQPIRVKSQVVSEGVTNIGANSYKWLTPYQVTGPANVCVIDGGFQNYSLLLGTELPPSVTVKSFTSEESVENGEVHGTAVSEIIYDIAPQASFFLGVIRFTSDLYDATNWAIEQKADVISYSLGSNFGPGDGRGFEDYLARKLRANGIYWVAAAGNSADDHWSGTFNDPDGNGWHNFSGDDEMLTFYVPAIYGSYFGVGAELRWNDWGTWSDQLLAFSGATQDYDLYLYVLLDNEWVFVDSSENRQPAFKYPYERIGGWYTDIDTDWGIKIKKKNATQNVYFDLFVSTHSAGSLEYRVPWGSLSIPADSASVIAVGAIDAVDNFYHYYSSRGPTLDGRIKPDLCAPSLVSVSDFTYGRREEGGGFAGTSASCPHMSGAMALLKSKTPFSMEQILQIIYGRAIDMGAPGPDNVYGRGRLNLRPK